MTIHCITKKPEDYAVETENGVFGLYVHYWQDQHLFSLMSRISSAFFPYEQGFEDFPEKLRMDTLDGAGMFAETLDQALGEMLVRDMMDTFTPREFTDALRQYDVKHLAMMRMFSRLENPLEALWYSALLRTLQYEHWHRGPIMAEGRVVRAQFASALTAEEASFLSSQAGSLKKAMEEVGRV